MAFFESESLWINQLADGVGALVLDVPDRKVNVLSQKVLADLDRALERVTETSFQLLLIRSGKAESFCAGADIQEFAQEPTPQEAMARAEQGQRLLARLADLPIPTVAVIAGACLGGGLELALACDYRMVVDKPRVQLGLPEIELGLLPAWGGTQRLPRVVGLERALHLILGARRLGPAEALAWGLVDDLVEADEERPPEFLSQPQKRRRTWLPLRTWRQKLLESTRLGRWLVFRGARRLLTRRLPDDMPAPWEALEAVRVGLAQGMEAGLAFEREALTRLVTTPACRNLVHLFFQREQARTGGARSGGVHPRRTREIRRVGIVGAGALGAGVAHLAVSRGFEVVVKERDEGALGLAMLRLMGHLEHSVTRGRISAQEFTSKLAAIHGTTAWRGFDSVDLALEAIDEDPAAKQAILREMEANVPDTAILASATTSCRVHELQQGLKHPERLAGLHFFAPVGKIPLVEIVPGASTEPDVADDLKNWVRKLGRTGMIVQDQPGFVVHRILMPYLNEALLLLAEGVPVERIDEAIYRFGMPQGPLEHLDQLGLDEAAALAAALAADFGDRIAWSPLFGLMVEQGWLGVKTGTGFYHYVKGRQKRHAAISRLVDFAEVRRPHGPILSHADQSARIRDRLVDVLIGESKRCRDEGTTPETIDLALVLAGAWPPHRGGPFRYAREGS